MPASSWGRRQSPRSHLINGAGRRAEPARPTNSESPRGTRDSYRSFRGNKAAVERGGLAAPQGR